MKQIAAILLTLAGCGPLPRDAEGTFERVTRDKVVRIGVIDDAHSDRRAVAALAARVSKATGARAAISRGAAEPLIAGLDEDRIDLVVGPFAKESPWRTQVTLAPPVAGYRVGETPLYVRAAVRNGENRWAMLVESASRQAAPQLADVK